MKGKELFCEDHAERLKESAGKLYRPSNGSEGTMFQDRFCHFCAKDNLDDDGKGGCEIILLSMCWATEDKDYPKEWIYDTDGQPICTAFDERE